MRTFFYIYNAGRIRAGHNFRVIFPIVVRGKGRISFGDNASIGKNAELSCASGGSMRFGNDVVISKAACIQVAPQGSFAMGRQSQLGMSTICYVHNQWNIGEEVMVASCCQLFAREKGCEGRLTIGNGSHIGDYTIMDISDDVTIGDNVAIGPRCTIYTHDHDFSEKGIDAPWKGKPICKPVIIENSVWIGANVTILPGVIIEKGAIIAAGAVVTKNIAASTLNAGIPSKAIKELREI